MNQTRHYLGLFGAGFLSLTVMVGNVLADSIAETEPNNTVAGAQNIDEAFGTGENPDIVNAATWPWVSIAGTGDGTFDFYSFEVPAAGVTGVFDIDYGWTNVQDSSELIPGDMDTMLFLYDADGNLIELGDDFTILAGAGGTTNGRDSYIEYTFEVPGTYVIAVGEFPSDDGSGGLTGNPPDAGDTYYLQVSLSEHVVASGSVTESDSDGDGFIDSEDCQPNSDLNPTVMFQSCDSGVPNTLMENGCTIADQLLGCAEDARNRGGFTSCVTGLTKVLTRSGALGPHDTGAIVSCASAFDVGGN